MVPGFVPLLIVVLAGATGCRPTLPPARLVPPGPPDMSDITPSKSPGTTTMIDTLNELIALLQSDVTPAQVIARLGTPTDGSLSLSTMAVAPRIAGVTAASVSVYPDHGPEAGAVYLTELVLSQPAALGVPSLRSAFGPFRETRSEPGRPRELLFERAHSGPKWTVVLLARVAAGSGALDEAGLLSVSLRRDPRE